MTVLRNPTHPVGDVFLRETQAAGRALGVTLQYFEARDPSQLDSALSRIEKDRAGALIVTPDPLFGSQRKRIVDFAERRRLPSMFFYKEFVDDGGLMSYGPSFPDSYRRAAAYVDKIIKGAKPADLPVEQPIKFEFIINLKAAKQIGLTIPPNVRIKSLSKGSTLLTAKDMKKQIAVLTLSAMLLALCFSAEAQQPMKVPRIGYLNWFLLSELGPHPAVPPGPP